MKENRTQATKSTILGVTLAFLTVLAPRAANIQCGKLPKDVNDYQYMDKDVKDCPTSCTVNYYDKATLCTEPSVDYAYCSMTDWDGSSCEQDAWVKKYPGTCFLIGSSWNCQQIPGAPPTTGPGKSPVPCLSGYDAEICPEHG